MAPAIVWFRRDLRLADNPAWTRACADGRPVVALYIHAPDEEGEWAPGAASRWWLHHSLAALDESLRALGGALVLRRGPSLDALRDVLATTGADVVYANRLIEPAAATRDAALVRDGIPLRTSNAAWLVEPDAIATGAGAPYRVFGPYWRNARERILERGAVAKPKRVEFARAPASLALEALKLLPKIRWDAEFPWRPGEASARKRLRAFVDDVREYATTRDRPDLDATSRLSPHLAFGEIGPRQVLAALQPLERVEPFVRELGWREFAAHVLHHFPRSATRNLDARFDRFDWAKPDAALLEKWQRGRTGVPLVDAAMRQLWQTGWMHNRARMVVASFLTKNLRMHWLHGARWFWDTLVDADLANNTLGWQWSAGTGVDAAPYFRIFNPLTQAQRFDPDGAYVQRWAPEARAPIVDLAASRNAALAAYKALSSSAGAVSGARHDTPRQT